MRPTFQAQVPQEVPCTCTSISRGCEPLCTLLFVPGVAVAVGCISAWTVDFVTVQHEQDRRAEVARDIRSTA